jgi:hypothetical protein
VTFDIDALIATAAPRTVEVPVCARGDLVDRHAALVRELADVEARSTGSIAGNKDVERVAQQIVEVEQEQEATTITLVLRSLPRAAWIDCAGKHPPRKEDKGLEFNSVTFPPAIVAQCCEALTEEQAVKLSEILPQGEWLKLWNAAVGLNVLGVPHPKLAAATEIARVNGSSSISQAPPASRDRASSAGSGEQ